MHTLLRIYIIFLKQEQLPCVLQARLWLSTMKNASEFEKMLKPGELKYYAETFCNEKKGTKRGKWVHCRLVYLDCSLIKNFFEGIMKPMRPERFNYQPNRHILMKKIGR